MIKWDWNCSLAGFHPFLWFLQLHHQQTAPTHLILILLIRQMALTQHRPWLYLRQLCRRRLSLHSRCQYTQYTVHRQIYLRWCLHTQVWWSPLIIEVWCRQCPLLRLEECIRLLRPCMRQLWRNLVLISLLQVTLIKAWIREIILHIPPIKVKNKP